MLSIANEYFLGQSISTWLLRYVVTIFLTYLVFFVLAEKFNTLMLPISFVPLPFIFLFISKIMRNFIDIRRSVESWELAAFYDGVLFSILFFVLTLILFIIFESIKKHKGIQLILVHRKIVLVITIAVSVVLVVIVSAVFIYHYLLEKNIKYTEVMSLEINDDITDEQLKNYYKVGKYSSLEYSPPHSISNNKEQKEFELLFGVPLPELNYRKYEYLVFIGKKAEMKDGVRNITEKLNMRTITVYMVNTVLIWLELSLKEN